MRDSELTEVDVEKIVLVSESKVPWLRSWGTMALGLLHTKAKGGKGNPQALREWYNDGARGRIRWGEDGDFMRCVNIAQNYMTAEEAKGFCNERHTDAVGAPPGKGHGKDKKK